MAGEDLALIGGAVALAVTRVRNVRPEAEEATVQRVSR
jgi:hypothetical protein